jgi:hypothetical protein
VIGQVRVFRPGHLELAPTVKHPDSGHDVPSEVNRVDSEFAELAHSPRGQCIAAGLVACDLAFLYDRDRMAISRQPVGHCSTCRAAADDENVSVQ